MLSSAFSSVRISPKGVQCPTAPVQKVRFKVAVTDAKGVVTLKEISRAPKPGELYFKVCECSEKKPNKASQDSSVLVATIWFMPEPIALPHPTQLDSVLAEADLPSSIPALNTPPVPPPDEA